MAEDDALVAAPNFDKQSYLAENSIRVSGCDDFDIIKSIDELDISDNFKIVLREKGIKEATPIQSVCWSIALLKRDMVGIAQTGSGKTLAFLIPALIYISKQPPLLMGDGPICLVLCPTRELAQQVQQAALTFGTPLNILNACVYGGGTQKTQKLELQRNPHIVIATPGRLITLLESCETSLNLCSLLILDEADRMLDLGFEPQIKNIIQYLRPDRQTLMFSATWPDEVHQLAKEMLLDYVKVTVGARKLSANKNIHQIIHMCEHYQKQNLMFGLLTELTKDNATAKIIIFVRTKKKCNILNSILQNKGFPVSCIHGDKQQQDREDVLNNFKTGTFPILVATSVASRGLDVDDISYVINFDFPDTVEDYIHRIGRTARYLKRGTSHSYFTPRNHYLADELVELLRNSDQTIPPQLATIARRISQRSSYNYNSRGRRPSHHSPRRGRDRQRSTTPPKSSHHETTSRTKHKEESDDDSSISDIDDPNIASNKNKTKNKKDEKSGENTVTSSTKAQTPSTTSASVDNPILAAMKMQLMHQNNPIFEPSQIVTTLNNSSITKPETENTASHSNTVASLNAQSTVDCSEVQMVYSSYTSNTFDATPLNAYDAALAAQASEMFKKLNPNLFEQISNPKTTETSALDNKSETSDSYKRDRKDRERRNDRRSRSSSRNRDRRRRDERNRTSSKRRGGRDALSRSRSRSRTERRSRSRGDRSYKDRRRSSPPSSRKQQRDYHDNYNRRGGHYRDGNNRFGSNHTNNNYNHDRRKDSRENFNNSKNYNNNYIHSANNNPLYGKNACTSTQFDPQLMGTLLTAFMANSGSGQQTTFPYNFNNMNPDLSKMTEFMSNFMTNHNNNNNYCGFGPMNNNFNNPSPTMINHTINPFGIENVQFPNALAPNQNFSGSETLNTSNLPNFNAAMLTSFQNFSTNMNMDPSKLQQYEQFTNMPKSNSNDFSYQANE